jgi:hypothetical protein
MIASGAALKCTALQVILTLVETLTDHSSATTPDCGERKPKQTVARLGRTQV